METALSWRRHDAGADVTAAMRPIAAIILLSALFAAITAAVSSSLNTDLDNGVLLALRAIDDPSRPIGPRWLPEVARNLTSLGSVTLLTLFVAVAAGFLLMQKRSRAVWRLLLAFAGGLVLLNALKWGLARQRPDSVLPFGEVFTYSFPSGHAALSTSTYLTFADIQARGSSDHRINASVTALCVAIILVAGLSRVYLGLHYPSDVLAGWCLGSAWAICCSLVVSSDR